MSADLHPSEGARYLFERQSHAPDAARYRATIFTPDAAYRYRAELQADGEWALGSDGEDGGGAPPELEKRLGNFARQLARAAGTKQNDGLPPWPARVLRWRR